MPDWYAIRLQFSSGVRSSGGNSNSVNDEKATVVEVIVVKIVIMFCTRNHR